MAQAPDHIRPDFLEKIARRQKERQQSFEALKQIHKLDDKAKEIVKLPVDQLLKKLQNRDLSATEVLSAYTAKALEVTEKVNCVTEFVPQAQKWAQALDEKAKDATAQLGPLHGLPFAVKDDQDVEGMDTTLGFAHNLYKPAKESAVIVQVLVKQGAVPFCKTNLPQSILSFGSDNPIYGQVKNGLNPELAPGGSSSGSGAIVGGGGAPVATGSDLGGSLRCPSHYHGISSLRGTTNRLSERGMTEGIPVITQRGVPGIIAPDAKTLALFWKCLTENNKQNELDPMAVPIPWNETLFSSKSPLKIGYFPSLPFFPAFPDTQKTILQARDALLSQGHLVVPFEPLDASVYGKIIFEHIFGCQEKWLLEQFDGEPLAICMKDFVTGIRAPEKPQEEPETGDIEKTMYGGMGEKKTIDDVLKTTYQKRTLTLEILGRMEKSGVDLILCPVFPHPAVKLEFGHKTMAAVIYTMLWNVVDFPTGVVRFGTETAGSAATYDDRGDILLKSTKEALKDSVGMPINVQVIGKPFKEELILRALCEIERLQSPDIRKC